jgi:glycine/D-amino acid oxidase-like deaminating enzyme
MTQGPASGELLARYIATGERPTALIPFDPLR